MFLLIFWREDLIKDIYGNYELREKLLRKELF